ncbi:4845_t:CDS:2, partial [Ambispora gerdemannii]
TNLSPRTYSRDSKKPRIQDEEESSLPQTEEVLKNKITIESKDHDSTLDIDDENNNLAESTTDVTNNLAESRTDVTNNLAESRTDVTLSSDQLSLSPPSLSKSSTDLLKNKDTEISSSSTTTTEETSVRMEFRVRIRNLPKYVNVKQLKKHIVSVGIENPGKVTKSNGWDYAFLTVK